MYDIKLKGRITAQIEDKNGHVKQSCTVENTITDAFLKRSLYAALSQSNGGVALRAVSKPTTGQYIGLADYGTFGIYALNREIEITRESVTPPYVTRGLVSLAADVTFYNNANMLTESAKEMISVDNRSVYRRKAGDNSFVVEYVKNSGTGSVRSICFGRTYSNPSCVVGSLIGESIYQPVWTTGTQDYFLEQVITGTPTEACPKGNQQATIVWKSVSSSSQFSANLVTKQITAYAASNLYTNITNASLTGGHVFTTSGGTKVVLKATYQAYTATSYTLTLYYCTDITGTTTVSSRSIEITAPDGVAFNLGYLPVMVSRPDTDKLEIFIMPAQGTFTILNEEQEEEDVAGCYTYKLTVETPTDPANSEITEEFIGVLPYGISQYNAGVGYYLSGFYFADLQNDDAAKTDKEEPEPVYYLPYSYYRDTSGGWSLYNSSWAAGIKTNADLTEFYGDYLARTSSSQQANIPVFTDAGILYCRVNSTTMYYVTLSGVISGANLPQTLTKGEDDILRLIYEYSLT